MSHRARSTRLRGQAMLAGGLLAAALTHMGCRSTAQPDGLAGLTGSGAGADTARGSAELCGGPAEPCCTSPVPECGVGLSCATAAGRCESAALAAERTRLCATDADCPASERCCPAGFVGTCEERAESPCPLPDLALGDDVDSGQIVVFTTEVSDVCSLDRACECLSQRSCASGTGRRRLLQVDPVFSNVGTADLVLGNPNTSGKFEREACSQELYLANFFRYELSDANGSPILSRDGRLVLACDSELDYGRAAPFEPRFSCDFRGLQRGLFLGDRFPIANRNTFGETDCTRFDITDVAPGDYELSVTINPARVFAESRYQNNVIRYPLRIPDFENPLQPCLIDSLLFSSFPLECGWVRAALASTSCTPGNHVRVGCPDCNNSSHLRICEGAQPCSAREELAPAEVDLPCPEAEFTCPPSGSYSAYVGSSIFISGEGSTRVSPSDVDCTPRVLDLPDAGL